MVEGAWCALVGLPAIAHAAAVAPEFAVDLTRLALVNAPGPEWPAVVATLLDGMDVVIVAPPPGVSAATARQLRAKARTHGAVLVCTSHGWDQEVPSPDADLTLTVTGQHTFGLGYGHGRIRSRALTVQAQGHGAATRPRQTTLQVPPASLQPSQAEPTGFPIEAIATTTPRPSTSPHTDSVVGDTASASSRARRDGRLVGLDADRLAS